LVTKVRYIPISHLGAWIYKWNTWELWVFVQQLPLLTQKQEVTRPFLVFLLAVTWTAGFSQMNRGTNMNREKQGIPWGDHHLREPWVVNGITDQKWRSKRVFFGGTKDPDTGPALN